jgi:hypothetical protein
MEFCVHLNKSSSHLDIPFVQNSSDISPFKPVYLPDYTGRPRHKYYVILLMSNIRRHFSWHLTIIKVKLHVARSFVYVCCPPQHFYICSPLRVKNRYRGAAHVNGYDISLKILESFTFLSAVVLWQEQPLQWREYCWGVHNCTPSSVKLTPHLIV